MFTKITLIILAIAIVAQSYCIRVLMEMIDETQEGYKLIDERTKELNNIAVSNRARISSAENDINWMMGKVMQSDL